MVCHSLLQWASLVAERLKCLPGMRETQVRSLGQEDPLEKEMAAHSSTLAWRLPWREEPGRLQSMGLQRVGHDWATSLTHSLSSERESEKARLILNIKKTNIRAARSITSWQIDGGEKWKQWHILFSWTSKSLQMVTAVMKLKDTCSWKKSYDNLRQCYYKAETSLC